MMMISLVLVGGIPMDVGEKKNQCGDSSDEIWGRCANGHPGRLIITINILHITALRWHGSESRRDLNL